MKRLITSIALLSVFFFSANASAEDDSAAAQEHFETGAEHYFSGDYGKAIVEFMKGHSIMPNGLFLYNISLSHVKLGNIPEALENAVAAQAMGDLDEGTSTQNDGRIVALRTVVTAQSYSAEFIADAGGEELKVSSAEDSGGFGTLGWIGVGTTVVGVGLLSGAMVMELGLRDTWDEYESAAANGDGARYAELKTQIEDDQSTGIILLAAGSGVTLVGLTLIAVELMSDDDASESASTFFMQPTRGGGIVGFSGAF